MTKHLLSILFLALIFSCNQKNDFSSPKGYDLNAPEKWVLDKRLREISGITFLNSASDTLLAINDEEGVIFYSPFQGKEINETQFLNTGGDFEDLTVFHDSVFVLRSDGTVITFSENLNQHGGNSSERPNVFPAGEYESLYADEESGKLFAICKKCDSKNQKSQIYGHYIDLKKGWESLNSFTIDLPGNIKSKKKGIQPSAMTKNKFTNEWYILASPNKLLIITDESFRFKDVHKLDPAIFNKPEGITFDSEGNLYISNEGGKKGDGNILKFSLKK